MVQPVIEARNLSRRFGDLVAVKDVSFDVKKAAIFGLLGPNGSGKSTIIRMLLGILSPSAGGAQVLGHDIRTESELIKHRVGYMSQSFSLYGDLTVRENIDFYSRIYGLTEQKIDSRAKDVLELTSLSDRVNQSARTLSGGWKQRLALACALVHEPDLLFLDEPTAGIDPVARRQLWDLLFDLSGRGVTLFVTTHYMDEAERCTEVGYIYQSRMLVQGRPDDLKSLPDVTPEGARRVEIQIPSPSSHLTELRNFDGVLDATLFGETIHLLVADDLTETSVLGKLHLPTDQARFREISPSLEDVFVTLTTSAEQDRTAGKEPPQHVVPPDKVESNNEYARTYGENELSDDASHANTTSTHAPESDELQDESQDTTEQPDSSKHEIPRGKSTDGFIAILTKEFAHIRRQRSTLVFVFVVPLMQTIIFGFALDTQIENIPMVVYDQDGRRQGRELIDAFHNTRRFTVVRRCYDETTFRRQLTSGRAKVGLRIPPNYSDRTVRGEQVRVQLLIDGSDSQVATTALNTSQLLGLNLSIGIARAKGEALQIAPARDVKGRGVLPIEIRPRLLYNPDLDSSHFFVPGLVGIILQLITLFLTSFAVVRERELGTLEQLFVTPVGKAGLLLGKLVPYAVLGFLETLIVLIAMVFIFGVPINGSVTLLLTLSILFMVCSLGLGLLVSTIARTQLEALQFAFIIMLPSVLLSGFMFPRSQMPMPIYLASFAIPVTYFIEILRGIVLRGADLIDLIGPVIGLVISIFVVLGLAITRFQKQLA